MLLGIGVDFLVIKRLDLQRIRPESPGHIVLVLNDEPVLRHCFVILNSSFDILPPSLLLSRHGPFNRDPRRTGGVG